MKPNILIVDDSKVICHTLEKLICEELDYNPISVYSKKECETILEEYKNKIDVALLDLELSDAKHGEVVDVVSKYGIPSIVLTSSIEKQTMKKDKNIVDYVVKESSFSFQYATSIVKRIINNYDKEVLLISQNLKNTRDAVDYIKRYQLKPVLRASSLEAMEELKINTKIKVVYIDPSTLEDLGLELIKQIRKSFTKNELVVSILITSDLSEEKTRLISKFLKYGANDIIYEDCTQEEFYARLTSNLDMLDHFYEMQLKANIDFLTGTYNRRYFFEEGLRRLNNEKNVKLCIIDIDKFKSINDMYGHDIGDIVIKHLSYNITQTIQEHDTLMARFGAEEFCILFFNITEEVLLDTLETLRKCFENASLETIEGEVKYTVSIGYCLEKKRTIDMMLNRAGKGLYKAKHSGRIQLRGLDED